MAEYEGTIDSFDEVPIEKQANPSFWRRVIQAYSKLSDAEKNSYFEKEIAAPKRARDALAMSGLASAAYIPAAIGQLGVNYTDFIDRQIGGAPTDPISKAIKSGVTSFRDYSNQAGQTAQKYWREQGSAVDPESLQGKLSEGVGSIPAGVVNWTPAMTAVNASNQAAEGDYLGAAKTVGLRAGLGKAFDILQKSGLGALGKQATASGLMAGSSALEGGGVNDIGAAAIMGGLIPIGGKSKPKKLSVFDKESATIAENYQNMIGIPTRTTPRGGKGIIKDVNNGVDAVLSSAEMLRKKGIKTPESRMEHILALGERADEVYNSYAPVVKSLDNAGVTIDLKPIAAELKARAENPVVRTQFKSDAKALMDMAASLEEQQIYTPSQMEEAIKMTNDKLKDAEFNQSIPLSGSVADLKLQNKLMLKTLINTAKENGFTDFAAKRREYGKLAEARDLADARIRREILKIKPDFFEGYKGAMTGIEMLKFAMAQGSLLSPGTAYGFKALYDRMRNPEKGVKKMYQAADRIIEDRAKQEKTKMPANLASPKAAYGIVQSQDDDEPQVYEGTIDSFD